jgi:hypothetical protein
MSITLGQLIQKLKGLPQDAQVSFDFCNFSPTTFDSWRGVYDYIALGYTKCTFSNRVNV